MPVRPPSLFRHLLPLLAFAAFAVPGYADTTGTLDTTFGDSGKVVDESTSASSATASAIALATPGSTTSKIWVAGLDTSSSVNHLVLKQYLSSGYNSISRVVSAPTSPSAYTFFAPQHSEGTQTTTVAMALQSDGKPILACLAQNSTNTNVVLLYRFTTAGVLDGDGVLDGTLDSDGIAAVTLPYEAQAVTGLAIDSGGRFLISGQAMNSAGDAAVFTIVRCTTAGALDTAFSSTGMLQPALGDIASQPSAATALALQSDGAIVACGWAWTNATSAPVTRKAMAIVRCTSTGTLDTTFDSDGVQFIQVGPGNSVANALVIQSDGRIAVAGSAVASSSDTTRQVAIIRLTTTGTLDTSFSNDGMLQTAFGTSDSYATGIAQYTDARLVIAGYAETSSTTGFLIARYGTDGTIDTTVGSGGLDAFNTGSQSASGVALIGSTYAYLTGGGTGSSYASFTTLRLLFAATSTSGSETDNSGSPYINTSCGLGSGIALGGLLAFGALLRLRLRRR